MATYIAISELQLKKSKTKQNSFSVYASLIDFFGDTKSELNNMIDFLCTKGIISFVGQERECTAYKDKFLVYIDGLESTGWLISIVEALKEYNKKYNDKAKLIISEEYILDKGILNLEFSSDVQEDMEKTIVTLYANTLVTTLRYLELNDLIKCKISKQNNNRFIAQYRGGYIVISKNTRYKASKQSVNSSTNDRKIGTTKINKTKARNLYDSGEKIYLLPCKVSLNSVWVKPICVSKHSGLEFDKAVNEFEYYNCNKELGTYASYYVNFVEK